MQLPSSLRQLRLTSTSREEFNHNDRTTLGFALICRLKLPHFETRTTPRRRGSREWSYRVPEELHDEFRFELAEVVRELEQVVGWSACALERAPAEDVYFRDWETYLNEWRVARRTASSN